MGVLSARVAVVTGGASGIGRATALKMAAEGASVVIGDIDGAGSDAVVETICGSGGIASSIPTDVSQPEQVEHLIAETVSRYGGLQVLCNNAADLSLLQHDGDFLQTGIDTWDRTYAADLRSVMAACKYAIPHMLAAGGGAIVNVSSVDGIAGDNTRFAYAAAKAGINILTQCTATTYGKRGIRCNAVLPGLVLSPPALETFSREPEIRAAFEDNVLTPHLGTPEEVAAAIVFLASDASSYINGQLLPVDGGLLSHVPHYAQVKQHFTSAGSE